MNEITRKDLVDDAQKRVTSFVEKENSAIKHAIENAAIITTLITIGSYIVMYAYKAGFYSVFNIPVMCVRVSLKDFLPMLFQISGLSIYILWYIVALKQDVILKRKRLNGYRIMYGYLIIYMILHSNGIFNLFPHNYPTYLPILFSIGLSCAMELFLNLNKPPKKDKAIPKVTQKIEFEDIVTGILIYRYYIKTGFFVLAVAVTLAPFWGKLIAKSNVNYQVFDYNEKRYAVIVDYDDTIIAQRVEMGNGAMAINTSSYLYLQKNGIQFTYDKFDSVSRVTSFIEESDGSQDEMEIIVAE